MKLEMELTATKQQRDEAILIGKTELNYFIKRVEDGTARSRTTYSRFKAALIALAELERKEKV